MNMSEKVLMKGNEALAEAALRAGCRHYFGYPITPQTEVAAYMARRMPQLGGVFLQAESEIAAINMVYGVAATGHRVMTSSSSPGISLKGEGFSYLAGADLPALVANVQRGGPGLGAIQPAQGDYWQATRGAGHGDFHMIVLAPASVQEMMDLTILGFDLADRYRMTCMILSDGTVGQMMEPVVLRDVQPAAVEKPWACVGTGMRRPKNVVMCHTMNGPDLEAMNLSRYERYARVEAEEARAEMFMTEDADICVVSFGIAARVARNAVLKARENGVRAGLIRPITLWPFPKQAIRETSEHCRAFVTVEMNMGQMVDDVRLAMDCARPVSMCNRAAGMIPTVNDIFDHIMEKAGALK